MAFEIDTKLTQLCEQREDVRIQLSLSSDAARPDTSALLNGRARLLLLEDEITARRRALGRRALPRSSDVPVMAMPRRARRTTPRTF